MHDPADVLLMSSRAAFRLSLVLARGQGWAEGCAPELVDDLAVARSVVWVGGTTQCPEAVLHVAFAELVADTAENAAMVLAGTRVPGHA